MATIAKEQTRRIYALGALTGLLESGNKEDALHDFVNLVTGKTSITSLTQTQARQVIAELGKLPRKGKRQPKAAPADAPGKMTFAQQQKAWALMYDLIKLDPSAATPAECMAGAIKHSAKVDVPVNGLGFAENPFVWLTAAQGHQLIKTLKRYVASAKRRQT
ncbi:regulatory protein GemA [Eubacterium aggregans]|uniref:regulatory protein GemA n=2 Tax=Eubacterium aggregans TaxID=81409 RepID=UPI003F40C917